MAKVYNYNPPPEVQELIARSLMPNWNLGTQQLILKNRPASYLKLTTIAGRSMLPVAGTFWRAFDQGTRDFFKELGTKNLCSGWAVGVMNFCGAVRQFDTLSMYAQDNNAGNTGCMFSPTLGQTFAIRQGHPLAYYVSQKVVGSKNRHYAQLISEPVPDTFKLDMMLSVGGINDGLFILPSHSVRGSNFHIKCIWRRYYGQFRGPVFLDQENDMPYNMYIYNLHEEESTLVPDYAGYDYIFVVQDFQGIFCFDTLKFEHNGYNYAFDWRCKKIDQKYTGHLAPVRPHWEIMQTYPGARYFSRVRTVD